jgi:hypothetical protein
MGRWFLRRSNNHKAVRPLNIYIVVLDRADEFTENLFVAASIRDARSFAEEFTNSSKDNWVSHRDVWTNVSWDGPEECVLIETHKVSGM